MTPWILVFALPLAAFVLAAVDMWRGRRREPDVCSPMNKCRECGEGS